jgi:hypothetical protein
MLRHSNNLGMALQLGKDLLAQTGSDLRVNVGVLNILVAEVVSHALNALAASSRCTAIEWRRL